MPWTKESERGLGEDPDTGLTYPDWSEEGSEVGDFEQECSVRGSSAVVGYAVAGCAVVGTDLAQTWGKEAEVTG